MKLIHSGLAFIAIVLITSTKSDTISVIPHDAHPGYSVKKFNEHYTLVNSSFSEFFTMLQDGSIMTVSDVSPLVDRPVDLLVLENDGNMTKKHLVQLYVLDRRDMLQFKDDSDDIVGRVAENQPTGTRVAGLSLIQASGSHNFPVTYSIIAGNTDQSFELRNSVTGENLQNVTVDNSGGVYLVTAQVLDREETPRYVLTIQASDASGINKAVTNIVVEVLDENDNSPVFTKKIYRFIVGDNSLEGDNITTNWKRFSSIGKVEAVDADGDKVAYRLVTPTSFLVIVPQTGDLLLALEPVEEVELELVVEAHDLRMPSRTSPRPAQVIFHFKPPEESAALDLQTLDGEYLERFC